MLWRPLSLTSKKMRWLFRRIRRPVLIGGRPSKFWPQSTTRFQWTSFWTTTWTQLRVSLQCNKRVVCLGLGLSTPTSLLRAEGRREVTQSTHPTDLSWAHLSVCKAFRLLLNWLTPCSKSNRIRFIRLIYCLKIIQKRLIISNLPSCRQIAKFLTVLLSRILSTRRKKDRKIWVTWTPSSCKTSSILQQQ